jgi:hypothetical protein
VNTAAPTITGTAARGSALTAAPGTWTPAATSVAYQWQHGTPSAGWTNIAGATAASYTQVAGDERLDVRVEVTASNSFGAGTVASSAPTGAVAAEAPLNVAGHLPTISSSKPAVGTKLTATTGTWTGVGNTYAYQWSESTTQGLVAIAGATLASFTPAAAERGDALVVTVTATNPDGTAKATSAATSPVPALKLAVKAPSAKPKAKAEAKAKAGAKAKAKAGSSKR